MTPHQDGLPSLPEPAGTFKDTYAGFVDSGDYTEDQVQAIQRKAFEAGKLAALPLPVQESGSTYDAIARAMDMASMFAGSVAMNNVEQAEAYSASLRRKLWRIAGMDAQPAQAPAVGDSEERRQLQHLLDDIVEEADQDGHTYYRIRDGADVLFSNMVGACARLLAQPVPIQLMTAEEARKDREHAEAYYRQAEKLLTANELTLRDALKQIDAALQGTLANATDMRDMAEDVDAAQQIARAALGSRVPVQPADTQAQPASPERKPLTDEQCDEFRRLPLSFCDMVRAIYAAGRAARAEPARCPYCDDTGDAHTPTGEWRGECKCKAALEARIDDYATEIGRLRNVIQAACSGGLDHMIERWKQLFPDAPVPTVREQPEPVAAPVAPSYKLLEDGKTAIPADWTPLRLEWEPGYPEDVAFGPQRAMDRLKKWLDAYFLMIQQRMDGAALSPPVAAAERSPLTDEQINALLDGPASLDMLMAAREDGKRGLMQRFARAIERAHGIGVKLAATESNT